MSYSIKCSGNYQLKGWDNIESKVDIVPNLSVLSNCEYHFRKNCELWQVRDSEYDLDSLLTLNQMSHLGWEFNEWKDVPVNGRKEPRHHKSHSRNGPLPLGNKNPVNGRKEPRHHKSHYRNRPLPLGNKNPFNGKEFLFVENNTGGYDVYKYFDTNTRDGYAKFLQFDLLQ